MDDFITAVWDLVRRLEDDIEIEDEATGELRYFELPEDIQDLTRDVKDYLIELGGAIND